MVDVEEEGHYYLKQNLQILYHQTLPVMVLMKEEGHYYFQLECQIEIET
jgi:hypothetical protein